MLSFYFCKGMNMASIRIGLALGISVILLVATGCGSSATDSGTNENNQAGDEAEIATGDNTNDESGSDTSSGDEVEDDADTDTDTDTNSDPGDDSVSEEDLDAMKVGDEWRLELDANATTGYEWAVQPGMDENVLVVASSEYVGPGESGGVGSGGTQVYIFRAVGTGSTSVLLHYARSWEPDSPAETWTFDVTVVD
jgi:predicted secreted protein